MKSMHILIFLFFFGTNTTFASHFEYLTSRMTFESNNLYTSAFAGKILSFDIFLLLLLPWLYSRVDVKGVLYNIPADPFQVGDWLGEDVFVLG